jgi:GNAT superfamily N-acetyltransferase
LGGDVRLIRLWESENAEHTAFCGKDVFAARVLAAFRSTPQGDENAAFWAQSDENGKTTATLSLLDGIGLLSASADADTEEICAFLAMLPWHEILTHAQTAQTLGMNTDRRGIIVRATQNVIVPTPPDAEILADADAGAVYDLLAASGLAAEADKAAWQNDLSRRVQAGTARMWLAAVRGQPAATLSALAVTAQIVFLGGLATKPEFRRKGLAPALLHAVRRTFSGKEIYLFCRPALLGFYEKNGFAYHGDWVSLRPHTQTDD